MMRNMALAILLSATHAGVSWASTVAVCEPLKSGDPHLSARIEQDYREAATIAFEHYKVENPGTTHQLKWCLETADPRQILERAATPDVMAIVGFAFSGAAKIAAQFAEDTRVTYLSPAAALDELFGGGFVKSLGIPMSKTATIAAEWLKAEHPNRPVHMLYAGDVAYARLQAQQIKRQLAAAVVEHSYMQVDEGSLTFGWLDATSPPVVILAGYAHHHFQTLKKLAAIAPKTTFLVTNQWAYAQDFVKSIIEGSPNIQLFAVSDFAAVAESFSIDLPSGLKDVMTQSKKRATKFADDHKSRFRRDPEAFSYAVYDAVYLALSNLQNDDKRETYLKRIDSSRWFAGVSGPVQIEAGRFTKPGYLLKWNGHRFVPVKMSF
jgi:ABC-type branched-subunit amino acid transport system substrate-binding protein